MKTSAFLCLVALGTRVLAAETPASCCAVPTADAAAPASAPACCPAPKPAQPSCCAEVPAAAPLSERSLYQLDTTWTNDAGNPVTLGSFRGQPVVLAMFFASCEYACPVLVNDMQRLRALLPDDVRATARFVLVSFDTARDTPEALRAFRERMTLDGAAWTLLRASDEQVQELAMLLGVKYKRDARGQFSHSNLITVLNREGEIAHQHAGLMGDVSEAARVVASVSK